MKPSPRTLGVVPSPITPRSCLAQKARQKARSTQATMPCCIPHWYKATALGSLQLVGKTAISARQAPLTNVGGWRYDRESLLKEPLNPSLEARQADLPYVVFLDPDRMRWQEETPGSFPPDAYHSAPEGPCVHARG